MILVRAIRDRQASDKAMLVNGIYSSSSLIVVLKATQELDRDK